MITPLSDTVLLVSTFDAYSPCWSPFCHGIQKYWPDCPFPIYFITNALEPMCGEAVKIGEDQGWALNLRYALKNIDAPFVLYCQEDYWLRRRVPTQEILDYLTLLRSDFAYHIRLYPAPPPDRSFAHDTRLGIIDINAEYRVSLQMGLWQTPVLMDLLANVHTGWDLERVGSRLTAKYGDGFLSVTSGYGIDYVFTAVVDGEWSPSAYDYAKYEEIEVDFAALPQKRKSTLRKIRKLLYSHIKRPLYRLLGRPRLLR